MLINISWSLLTLCTKKNLDKRRKKDLLYEMLNIFVNGDKLWHQMWIRSQVIKENTCQDTMSFVVIYLRFKHTALGSHLINMLPCITLFPCNTMYYHVLPCITMYYHVSANFMYKLTFIVHSKYGNKKAETMYKLNPTFTINWKWGARCSFVVWVFTH